ncbi:unnamed protein product [Chondrus crispus]|uniref:Uncharacterized protein n=1 Tax=Chondrus crispus TaxID=2769 RepID=R7QJR2_CHOCR|nr:unnamed protein product [Chondrus crispus]CDF37711.1 unnamed protein product [Chondrus crispus]|eukprot:XP_005717582.1 unnamed protein product [Chondrus crispus]
MSAPLPRALAAVALLSRRLRCPSCEEFLAAPHRVAACGHVVCGRCAARARDVAKCPLLACGLPTTPAEVRRHRDVCALSEAVAALAAFADGWNSMPCAVRVRVRQEREARPVPLTIRVREPAVQPEENGRGVGERAVQLRLRVRPPPTATRKRPRTRRSPTSVLLQIKQGAQDVPIPGNDIAQGKENHAGSSQSGRHASRTIATGPSPYARPAKRPKAGAKTTEPSQLQFQKEIDFMHGRDAGPRGQKEVVGGASFRKRNGLPEPAQAAQYFSVDSKTGVADVLNDASGLGQSTTNAACSLDANTVFTLPTTDSSKTERPRLLSAGNEVASVQGSRASPSLEKTSARKATGRCAYDPNFQCEEMGKIAGEAKRQEGIRNSVDCPQNESHAAGIKGKPLLTDEEISPLSFKKVWPPVAASERTDRRLSFTDGDGDMVEKCAKRIRDGETIGSFTVCLTGLSRGDQQLELAEEMMACLGGEILEDMGCDEIPRCVVTLFDISGNVKNRTMLLHEAVVRRVPVVNIEWLVTSFLYGGWAQTAPFQARINYPTEGKGVFDGVLASFDRGFSGANALALVRKAGDDIRRLVRAGGAVVAETKDVAGLLSQHSRFSLHVHVACDFGENSSVGGGQVCAEEMELLRCSQNTVGTRVVSMGWISECIFSGMCPPATNDKSESMSAFSEYSLSDSERTCAPPSTTRSEGEAVR